MSDDKKESIIAMLASEEYLKRIAPIFVLTSFVFMFSIFIGYSIGEDVLPQSFEGILSNIPDPNESTSIEVFTAILWNNIMASFIFVVSGVFVGIPPLMFIAFNGFYIGYIVYNVARSQGMGLVLLSLLPHGVIEIPTIILSASVGVGLGYQLIHKLMRKDGLQEYVMQSFMLFVMRVIPLLVLAAGIETALIYYVLM